MCPGLSTLIAMATIIIAKPLYFTAMNSLNYKLYLFRCWCVLLRLIFSVRWIISQSVAAIMFVLVADVQRGRINGQSVTSACSSLLWQLAGTQGGGAYCCPWQHRWELDVL